jgi:hypothetical protein
MMQQQILSYYHFDTVNNAAWRTVATTVLTTAVLLCALIGAIIKNDHVLWFTKHPSLLGVLVLLLFIAAIFLARLLRSDIAANSGEIRTDAIVLTGDPEVSTSPKGVFPLDDFDEITIRKPSSSHIPLVYAFYGYRVELHGKRMVTKTQLSCKESIVLGGFSWNAADAFKAEFEARKLVTDSMKAKESSGKYPDTLRL